MYLINESEIFGKWAPILESNTGITERSKVEWMSKYCHYHELYENNSLAQLGAVNGMGSTRFPGNPGTQDAFSTQPTGSGDKAHTLLPLAMQVAAQTVGLDLVPVVPMPGPMGVLTYLDFVYGGGQTGTTGTNIPLLIKANVGSTAAIGASSGTIAGVNFAYVGASRLDGNAIFHITGSLSTGTLLSNLAGVTGATAFFVSAGVPTNVELVKALEDHITGFSGQALANNDYTGTDINDPYSRALGESTTDNVMNLSLFNKSVEAKTFQVAAAVTREQVQDLKQFGVDAVAQVEAVLVNELTQNINDLIINNVASLGASNITKAAAAGEIDSTQKLNIFLNASASFTGGQTEGSEHRKILTGILAAANLIANRGRRGAGNFAVVGPQVATVLQSVAGFVPNPFANTISQAAGAIYPVGSVAGIQVYTNPKWAWNYQTVLVGRKGDGNGPGLVFMPYLMAESVQTIAEGTMAPKIAVKSRFALVEAGFHPETQYVTFEIYNGASGTTRFTNLLNLV